MRTEAGTRERKRALKAMPTRLDVWSPLFSRLSLGYLAVCLGLFWLTKSTWWLALAVPVVVVIVATATQRVLSLLLLAESRRRLESRGIRCLVVYSESPVWEEHIRSQWLSRLGSRAVVLNWSHRTSSETPATKQS